MSHYRDSFIKSTFINLLMFLFSEIKNLESNPLSAAAARLKYGPNASPLKDFDPAQDDVEPKQDIRKGPVLCYHDDVIKWKHFPHYWPFVRGIHRSPVNSPHKGQWRGALMFSMICIWINGWVNNHEAVDLTGYRAHYGVTVMETWNITRRYVRCSH